MVRRRRNKRREPTPPSTRLDERLTALDLDKLERELSQFLKKKGATAETALPAAEQEAPAGPVAAAAHRPLVVPEAEVTIVRRAGAGGPRRRAAETVLPAAAPPHPVRPHKRHPNAPGADAPSGAFDGVVEEATVVIIRRAPGGPKP